MENKCKEKICYIMRGIPNSGKSFTAKQILKSYGENLDPKDHIFSTDDFYIQDLLKEKRAKQAAGEPIDHDYYNQLEKETYRANWHPSKLGQAHGWNQYRFKEAVDNGITPLLVDNTGITAKECYFYVKCAKENGYKVIIKESDSPWWKDISPLLVNKQKYGTELENFARFLAGHHKGLSEKYGTSGNQHGVPLDVIRNMIRKWQPNLTPEEILNGRN